MAETGEKRRIGYISEKIVSVKFPRLDGERYEALVPDTFDICERAEYAIRCFTNVVDPTADYEMWWLARLYRKPPIMYHSFHDLNIAGKFYEALPNLRIMTGSTIDTRVDQVWPEVLLRMQGEDGLVYMPVRGRPWARHESEWLEGKGDDGKSDQLASIVADGIFIGVMGFYYSLSGDQLWKERVERLVDRMAQLMVYREDYCYFPIMAANPGAEVSPDMEMLDPGCMRESGGACAGWIIQGLCQAYEAARYKPALDLAGKLAVYLMRFSGCYDKEGRFTGCAHTHLHTRPISALLEYALMVKDPDMVDFCRKAYEYARSCGNPAVGFFPSILGPDVRYDYATIQKFSRGGVEGCTVADMVALAIKLSQAGVADYWDDADRYIRNQFAEIQILRSDWIDRMVEPLPPTPVDASKHENADRVAGRNIGACIGISSPNDILDMFLMHCCTGNYARALPYIWDNILTFEEGTLRVNLLLNHTSKWADIESYIPYEGRVDVKIRSPCKVSVRVPEWVNPEDVSCDVKGRARKLSWDGRYAQVGEVYPGDVVVLVFPIAEHAVKTTMGGVDYTLVIKGNTVVFIDPPGKYYPFYQRAHYRENKVRWVERSRFIPSAPQLHWHY